MATHTIETDPPAFSPLSTLPSVTLIDYNERLPSIDDSKSFTGASSEKVEYTDVDKVEESSVSVYNDEDVLLVNGDPVIRTGLDVSKYAVDIRDDHDPAMTFRSFFLGSIFAGLGSALGQVSGHLTPWFISCRYNLE